MPAVTYLLPAMRCDEYLIDSLKSIDADEFQDKEILIIDNGNDQINKDKILSIANIKTKLNVVLEGSRGVAHALNAGLEYCDSKYIARLDSDDLNLNGRTRSQFDALEKNPRVAGLGGQAILIDAQGRKIGHLNLPRISSLDEMRCTLRFENPYAHPAMMIRTDILREFGYNPEKIKCQDWDLWIRMAKEKRLIGNLPARVICYRRHSNQESVSENSVGDAKALRETLLNLDEGLGLQYMFQRGMLEKHDLRIEGALKIIAKELPAIKNMYSLKKFAGHVWRAFLK